MSTVELDWSTAEVRDRRLEVYLRGELPNGWKDRFESTVTLLGGGEWGTIKLKKDRVRVRDIPRGDEDRVHHHLESVVRQANAAFEQPETTEKPPADDHEDRRDDPDAEMTARFRSFADSADD